MIRLAGIRTGVEISAGDDIIIVPTTQFTADWSGALAGMPNGWPYDAFTWTGTELLNPFVGAYPTVVDGMGKGQLVLCSPIAGLVRSRLLQHFGSQVADADKLVDAMFMGLAPGIEEWRWKDGTWPSQFVLRAPSWPTPVRDFPTVQAFMQAAFPSEPAVEPTAQGAVASYVIWTDRARHQRPVGGLVVYSDRQIWFGASSLLVDSLIAPGPNGTWEFRLWDPSVFQGGDYVRLELVS